MELSITKFEYVHMQGKKLIPLFQLPNFSLPLENCRSVLDLI